MIFLWLQFAVCGLLILIFGYKLSGYADRISSAGHFSEGFMGILFLAAVTSFPEIFVSVAAVLKDLPDMAVGDPIGAIILNILLLYGLGLFYRKGKIFTEISKSQAITCSFTLISLIIVGAAILARAKGIFELGVFGVGIDSLVLISLYVVGMRVLYKRQSGRSESGTGVHRDIVILWLKFALAAAVIILCGIWLADLGRQIITATGLGAVLVGTVFLAIATTLPELCVSLFCFKRGQVDMAVGNLTGSAFFNITILFLLDVFFRKGQLLSHISISHLASLSIAGALIATVIIGFYFSRSKAT